MCTVCRRAVFFEEVFPPIDREDATERGQSIRAVVIPSHFENRNNQEDQ